MEAPAKLPFAVLRAVVCHARGKAISQVTGWCSGLRKAMDEREPDSRVIVDRHGQEYQSKCYGQSVWRGVAWEQTDAIARTILGPPLGVSSHLGSPPSLRPLRWSGDHYSFVTNGMYVGIELDGYMHT